MIYPTIHLNGTSADELMLHYEQAASALRRSIDALEYASPNARDYYTRGDGVFKIATTEHAARIELVKKALSEIVILWEHVQSEQDKQ